VLGLTLGSAIAGLVSWGTLWGLEHIWGTEGLLLQLLQLAIAGLMGLGAFALFATRLKLPEVDIFVNRLRQRFIKSS
jgi:putative peptidoglycan lipid II flippase